MGRIESPIKTDKQREALFSGQLETRVDFLKTIAQGLFSENRFTRIQ
jgi:hypothetical protein